jgi:hypothetical protein
MRPFLLRIVLGGGGGGTTRPTNLKNWRRTRVDLGLVEYAVWVTFGLWGTLFAGHPIVRGAGFLLIVLAVLRALTEKSPPS